MLTNCKLVNNVFFRKFKKVRFFSWNEKNDNAIFQSPLQLYIPDDMSKDQNSPFFHKSLTSVSTVDHVYMQAVSTISPEVVYSMIKAGFDKGDYETVQLVINEAKSLGNLSGETLEKTIVDLIHAKDYKHTMILFMVCIENNFTLSNLVCKAFHAQLVGNCYWFDAVIVAEYMIKCNYQFRSLDIYFLVSGLMKDTSGNGLSKALSLIQLISEYRRTDLSSNFDFSKAKKLSLEYVDSGHSFRRNEKKNYLAKDQMNSVVDTFLNSLREHNWWSFSMCKMLVALACATGHSDAAVRLIKVSIETLVNRKSLQLKQKQEKVTESEPSSYSSNITEEDDTLLTPLSLTSKSNQSSTNTSESYIISYKNINNSNYSLDQNDNPAHSKSTDYLEQYLNVFDEKEDDDLLSIIRGLSQGAGITKDTYFKGRTAAHFKNVADVYQEQRIYDTTADIDAINSKGYDTDNVIDNGVNTDDNSQHQHILNERNTFQSIKQNRYKSSDAVCSTVLRLSIRHIDHLNLLEGPVRMLRYLSNYWILSHKVHLWSTNPIKPDKIISNAYEHLLSFHYDFASSFYQFKVKSGYERRNFLILCDIFNFKHQVRESKKGDEASSHISDEMIVKVWKPEKITNSETNFTVPPTLEELLRKDGLLGELRTLDGLPTDWNEIEKLLLQLPERDLQIVVINLLRGMSKYPSSSWALKFIDIFKASRYKFPVGFLRTLLAHCKERNDPYGVLEVLYLAKEIQNSSISNVKIKPKIETTTITTSNPSILLQSLKAIKNSDLLCKVEDKLDSIDWNRAISAAWFGHMTLPVDAFEDTFNEVVQLMRQSGVKLEAYSVRILMRFLVKTQPESATTSSLFFHTYNDRVSIINHWENIALTILLTKLMSRRDRNNLFTPHIKEYPFRLMKPPYKSENYLSVYPKGLNNLASQIMMFVPIFGQEFCKMFNNIWARRFSRQGRFELYNLMYRFTQPKTASSTTVKSEIICRQEEIASQFPPNARYFILKMSIYSAYLMVADEYEFRKAYDLLYTLKIIIDKTNEIHTTLDKQNFDEEYNSKNENPKKYEDDDDY